MQIFSQDDIQRIAVIGPMVPWAAACALAGYPVRIYAPHAARRAVCDDISTVLQARLEQGLNAADLMAMAHARIHIADDPSDALLDAQFVVAAQPDQTLVRTVDTYTSPRAAVCCAGLNARHLKDSRHPERWLALVEGTPVPLLSTAPQAFETARMFYLSFFPDSLQ